MEWFYPVLEIRNWEFQMGGYRVMQKNHYTTSPPIIPELPAKIDVGEIRDFPMYRALPITRAVLLAAVEALKQVPGGAKRTQYSLERACFHLKRVKIKSTGRF